MRVSSDAYEIFVDTVCYLIEEFTIVFY